MSKAASVKNSSRGVIESWQVLRALAALSVVLFHLSYELARQRHFEAPYTIFAWRFGRFGVILFFVLSGALMARLAVRQSPERFLAHRLARIYPIYWIAAVAAIVATHFEFRAPLHFDVWALTLAPGAGRQYLLGVEWTLPFELTFYIIVALAMLARAGKYLGLIAIPWFLAAFALYRWMPATQQDWQFPTLPILALTQFSAAFAAGLCVPFLSARTWAQLPLAAAFVALLAASEFNPGYATWLVTLACAALVAAASAPNASAISPPALVKLGDWSYGLYLCHIPIILTVLHYAPPGANPWALWSLALFTCIAGGVLLGCLDVTLHAQSRRAIDRAPAALRLSLLVLFLLIFIGSQAITP